MIVLALVLHCSPPVIQNRTSVWTLQDQKTLERAKTRCGEIYPDAPCVKLFRKTEELSYNVICGKELK